MFILYLSSFSSWSAVGSFKVSTSFILPEMKSLKPDVKEWKEIKWMSFLTLSGKPGLGKVPHQGLRGELSFSTGWSVLLLGEAF